MEKNRLFIIISDFLVLSCLGLALTPVLLVHTAGMDFAEMVGSLLSLQLLRVSLHA